MLNIYGNTLYEWAIALCAILFINVLFYYGKQLIVKKFELLGAQTSIYINTLLAGIISSTQNFLIFLISLCIGLNVLTLPANLSKVLSHLIFASLLLQIGLWVDKTIRCCVEEYQHRQRTNNPASLGITSPARFILRMMVWIIITLFIFENLGFNITTLVASLGIGGIAVALAVQSILGDLLASLSIVLDKPFAIGDFIVINDAMGTVEYIGLKTTRLRSLSGEQIIFSNANLLKERINNYKIMYERRVVFNINVTYQTKKEQVKAIPDTIKKIILNKENVKFDRAHFKEFSVSALNFEIVYYVTCSDYNIYMDIQQAINLEILEWFDKNGIQFAYPSQTLYLHDKAA